MGPMSSQGSLLEGAGVRGESDVMMEAEIGLMHFEDGGRDHKPSKTGS